LILPMPELKDSVEFRFWLHHVCILDWLIKIKWDSTRKLIFQRKGPQFKPIAMLWRTVIDLCLELHPYVKEIYPSAAEWFGVIYSELELGGLSTSQGKAIDLKRFKEENGKLRSFNNPFKQPATAKLIDIAILRAGTSDIFRKEKYNPLLKARAALTQLYSSPIYSAIKEIDGEIFAGRSKLVGRYTVL
jgi:hypothetical protein